MGTADDADLHGRSLISKPGKMEEENLTTDDTDDAQITDGRVPRTDDEADV